MPPEDNPADDQPIDRKEYEAWEAKAEALAAEPEAPPEAFAIAARETFESMKPWIAEMGSADSDTRLHGRVTAYAMLTLGFRRFEAKLEAAIIAEREEWNKMFGVQHPKGKPVMPASARLMKAIFTEIDPSDG